MAAAITAALFLSGCGNASSEGEAAGRGADSPAPVGSAQPAQLSPAEMQELPRATTHTKLPEAPQDPQPSASSDGVVLKIEKPTVVYARPGGQPLAVLPPKQLDGPTWVPVVETAQAWRRVLLPTRPNHSTGWIHVSGKEVTKSQSSHVVKVDVSARRLTVSEDGQQLGSWSVAVGASDTPTPTGRTFVLALLSPAEPTYSPLILPLGAHSDTLKTYGGGPGTVGFHGWKDKSVFGKAVTHGCVRVPAAALDVLSQVPLGSLVLVRA